MKWELWRYANALLSERREELMAADSDGEEPDFGNPAHFVTTRPFSPKKALNSDTFKVYLFSV